MGVSVGNTNCILRLPVFWMYLFSIYKSKHLVRDNHFLQIKWLNQHCGHACNIHFVKNNHWIWSSFTLYSKCKCSYSALGQMFTFPLSIIWKCNKKGTTITESSGTKYHNSSPSLIIEYINTALLFVKYFNDSPKRFASISELQFFL